MKDIEVKVLNPEVAKEAEKMMVCAARLTQSGHKIKNMSDFMELYNKDYKEGTAKAMVNLPHPTIQKFGVINLCIVGASRRFLAQITRHENEVKFMSSSCQYSNWTSGGRFCVPYDILEKGAQVKKEYINQCQQNLQYYKESIDNGVGHDDASYALPQGLRNILIISATPFQFKHMISQRVCRRNTTETRFVMLKVWEALREINPILFGDCGPFCARGNCKEGKMSCGIIMSNEKTPSDFLREDYPLIYKS